MIMIKNVEREKMEDMMLRPSVCKRGGPLASCLGERGGTMLLSALVSKKVMRGTRGDESGLLPVGLNGGTERKQQSFF